MWQCRGTKLAALESKSSSSALCAVIFFVFNLYTICIYSRRSNHKYENKIVNVALIIVGHNSTLNTDHYFKSSLYTSHNSKHLNKNKKYPPPINICINVYWFCFVVLLRESNAAHFGWSVSLMHLSIVHFQGRMDGAERRSTETEQTLTRGLNCHNQHGT